MHAPGPRDRNRELRFDRSRGRERGSTQPWRPPPLAYLFDVKGYQRNRSEHASGRLHLT